MRANIYGKQWTDRHVVTCMPAPPGATAPAAAGSPPVFDTKAGTRTGTRGKHMLGGGWTLSATARVVLLSICTLAAAPQQGFNGQGMPTKPAPQPLDQVLMQVFDKDMSKSVSEKEVLTALDSFAEMSGMGAPPDSGGAPNQMEMLIKAAKRLAPSIFRILDADDSKGLSAAELKWVAKAQKAFNSGDMRNLTRDVFDTVDADHDDSLSAERGLLPKGVCLQVLCGLVDNAAPSQVIGIGKLHSLQLHVLQLRQFHHGARWMEGMRRRARQRQAGQRSPRGSMEC